MATRPWLRDAKDGRGKAGRAEPRTHHQRLLDSLLRGRQDATVDEDRTHWYALVAWALAQKQPKFAQVAVPAALVEEITAHCRAGRPRLQVRVGDSLTEEFRMLTLWQPPRPIAEVVAALEGQAEALLAALQAEEEAAQ